MRADRSSHETFECRYENYLCAVCKELRTYFKEHFLLILMVLRLKIHYVLYILLQSEIM